MYKYPDGDVYLGHFKNDVFHIEGIYIFNIGERYEGDFCNGKK